MHGKSNTHIKFDKTKDLNVTLKRLLPYLKPFTLPLATSIVFLVLSTFFMALAPMALGNAINVIQEGFMSGAIDYKKLYSVLFFLCICYTLYSLFAYLQQYIIAGSSQKIIYNIRKEIDEKLPKLPLNYFDSNTFGDILSRVTNDVDTLSTSFQQSISQIFSSILTIVFILIMMITLSPMLTLIGLITLPLSVITTMQITKRSQKFFKSQQKELANINSFIEENFNCHQTVKSYNKEDESVKNFTQINDRLYDSYYKAQFLSGLIMPTLKVLGNLGYVLVCIVGGYGVITGVLWVGDITSFIQYLRQFNQPLMQLASISNIIQSTGAAAERIFEFLDEKEEIPENTTLPKMENVKGDVTIKNVAFGYSHDKILIKNLSLHINSGDKVAIVGPTGSGKTTLVNLLLRFYDVNSGQILIDGVDIRDMKRIHLREIFGMVLQDTWLFNGSIMDNIRYGNLFATDDEVIEAAKSAYANNFIRTLPKGYGFVLNEDSSNISQGERQLITIARAILANPSIMILDEATSSVDTRTEMLIQKAMKNLMQNRTSFVIAHRLSTIVDSDVILVLKDGDIIETGSHDELMAQNGFYCELYNSQFAK